MVLLNKLKTPYTITNAIITLGDTDDSGKGRHFKSRFIQPGVAGYPGQFGNVLIKKESLDKFIKTMVGVPVIINHKDINKDNADDLRVGVVNSVWYDNKDGWYWCDGIIWDETAQNLITDKNWSVSCSYDVKTANDEGGSENNIKYDMEFLDGVFTHLALVNNPRYERANIVFNSKTEIVNDKWITIHPNGEDEKGRHLLLKDGETPKEAIDRVYKKEDKNEDFEKETKSTKKDEDRHQKVRDLEDKAYKEFKTMYDNYIDKDSMEGWGGIPASRFAKAKEQFNKKYKDAFDKLESDRFVSFEDFAKRENKQSDKQDKKEPKKYNYTLTKKEVANDSWLGGMADTGNYYTNGTFAIDKRYLNIKGQEPTKKEEIEKSLKNILKGDSTYRYTPVKDFEMGELKSKYSVKPVKVAKYSYFDEKYGYERNIYIDKKYNDLFKNFDLKFGREFDPIYAYDNGKIVGVVMPMDGREKSYTKVENDTDDDYQENENQLSLELKSNNTKEDEMNVKNGFIENDRGFDGSEGKWITIKGTHVFIPDGKTVEDVMKEKGWSSEKSEKKSYVPDQGEDSPRHIYGKREKDSIPVATKDTMYPGWTKVEVLKEFDDEETALDYAEERGEKVKSDYINGTKEAKKYGLVQWMKPNELEFVKKNGYYPEPDDLGLDDLITKKGNKDFSGMTKHKTVKEKTLEGGISETTDEYGRTEFKKGNKWANVMKNGNYYFASYGLTHKTGVSWEDEKGITHDQLLKGKGFKTEKGARKWALEQLKRITSNNAKEQTMFLIEELKKLITKVENDKGEDDMEIKNEKVDKRKLIDEVAGIMKSAGCDDEDIRTAIGKMEKIGYDDSEKSADNKKCKNEDEEDEKEIKNCGKKAKNEDDEEEVDEVKEEVKEDVDNKCKNSKYFDVLTNIYNSSAKAQKSETQYVSRADREQAAIDYFSK